MMERTSERIWRAARAAYESRGQLKVFMPWDDLRQVSRDIEYDAMVAAFDAATAPALKASDATGEPVVDITPITPAMLEAGVCAHWNYGERHAGREEREDNVRDIYVAMVAAKSEPQAHVADHPGCMAPDGAEPCPQYTAALARINELEAEVRRLQNNEENDCDLLGVHERRIAELEAERDKAENDDGMVSALVRTGKVMLDRIEALEDALKPFAEYAERVKEHMPGWFHDNFKFFHGGLGQYDVPMAWFIAALKAYRGEPAPPSEDKT